VQNTERTGYIWAGCVVLGSAVGFALSQAWGYGVGMPIGGALGVGAAFLLLALRKR
jgi:hypothetical protein